jgi:hypothetical protein
MGTSFFHEPCSGSCCVEVPYESTILTRAGIQAPGVVNRLTLYLWNHTEYRSIDISLNLSYRPTMIKGIMVSYNFHTICSIKGVWIIHVVIVLDDPV